jgi:hypothetical protein
VVICTSGPTLILTFRPVTEYHVLFSSGHCISSDNSIQLMSEWKRHPPPGMLVYGAHRAQKHGLALQHIGSLPEFAALGSSVGAQGAAGTTTVERDSEIPETQSGTRSPSVSFATDASRCTTRKFLTARARITISPQPSSLETFCASSSTRNTNLSDNIYAGGLESGLRRTSMVFPPSVLPIHIDLSLFQSLTVLRQ